VDQLPYSGGKTGNQSYQLPFSGGKTGNQSYLNTRKSINTNGKIKGKLQSVNFRGILPTKIFSRYIPKELQWEKNKTKQTK